HDVSPGPGPRGSGGRPTADTRLSPSEGAMTHVEQWARVRARTNCQLRRGAWYRVVELAPVEVVLEVNRRLLRVPRPFVQVPPVSSRLKPACCGRATTFYQKSRFAINRVTPRNIRRSSRARTLCGGAAPLLHPSHPTHGR